MISAGRVTLNSPEGKWIMAATILASAMAFIDGTAMNVVFPSLQRSLHASGPDLFWILNAYLLMLASFILVGGSLGDKLGRKRIFSFGILVFILGSAACGFASSVSFLIKFRLIQGLGGALMIPGSLSIISSSIRESEKGNAIGTWSTITTIVTIGGPVLGGALADAGLWRYIFFINVPIGIIALLILGSKVKEIGRPNKSTRLDFPGVLTIALGLAALTYGFLRIPDLGFHGKAVFSLAIGLIGIVSFLFIEGYSRHPMMPLGLFRNPSFTGANLLTFFLYAGLGAGMLFLSLNLVQAQGYSQFQSGLTFLPFTILMILVARPAGSWSDKIGPRLFLVVGPAVAGAGLLLLSFVGQTRGSSGYWTSFFPGILLLGAGMSCTVAPLTTTVMSSVDDRFSGLASGINNSMTRISGVLANAIFGALAVLFFASSLGPKLDPLRLDPSTKEAALAQAKNLGNAKPPSRVDTQTSALLNQSYRSAFIEVYRRILRCAAALAFLGALSALVFVRTAPRQSRS
jgi:EmrB/QacA subfamily drug resistance transporter